MKLLHLAIGTMLLFASTIIASCESGNSRMVKGNWYCDAVNGFRYTNVGHSGKYREVTAMNSDGTCFSSWKNFDGPISPLDEEISLHFRGPIHINKLAVYTPSHSTKTKRDVSPAQARRHTHQQFHDAKLAKKGQLRRDKPEMVVATILGAVVSWENNYFGPSATPAPGVDNTTPQMVTATINGEVVSWVNNWYPDSTVAAPVPSPTPPVGQGSSSPPEPPTDSNRKSGAELPHLHPQVGGSGDYERIGYYDAATQTLDGLVFLGNYGGQGSGVFDNNFGASLSYVNSEGTGGASSPQVISDKVIPSNSEVIVMAGRECKDDCGYVRPGSIAYHGFAGPNKIFFFEFDMPLDGNQGFNGDLPAIWTLNAQIPRTLQYGKAECSCWQSGCGEFDIVEALHPGSTFLKSTLHANQLGGASDYLERPTTGPMKLAVVFSSSVSTIHIQKLPEDFDFATTIATSEIDKICENGRGHDSLFPVQ